MAVKKSENKDNKQTKKKTTGKTENKVVKERNTVRSGTNSNGSSKKKIEVKVSDGSKPKGSSKKTKSAPARPNSKSNKVVETAIPEIKDKLSTIIPNAYGVDKFKGWLEQAEETTCTALKVVVKSNAGRSLHNFQIKLYLRELAEKAGWALTDLQLFDDHFEFIVVKPTIIKTLEVDLGDSNK